MSQIYCLVYLSILVSGDLLVQSIQGEIFTYFVGNFTANEVRFMIKVENITNTNSKSKWKQQENLTDHQISISVLNATLKLAKNSTKDVVTNVEENNDYARQYNLSRDWERENRQKRQVATDEEVETDDTIYMTFSEKERKDGYKRTRAVDSPYAVLVVVFIQKSKYGATCSGTLVTPLAVLTAAHCFDDNVDRTYVYAGGDSLSKINEKPRGTQLREAKSVYIHPSYSKEIKAAYDVAVVKVTKAFKMTRTVKTLKIGKRPWTHDGHKACKLTGFGRVYYNKPDPEDNTRKTHYLEVNRICPCIPTDGTLLCDRLREDYGICSGDSGGGLVCDGVVVAVACAGVEFIDRNNCTESKTIHCGYKNTLSLFQETGPYLDWINSKVNRASTGRSCHLVLFVLLMTTFYTI